MKGLGFISSVIASWLLLCAATYPFKRGIWTVLLVAFALVVVVAGCLIFIPCGGGKP